MLRTLPAANGELFLNDSIAIEFSSRVDLSTADFSAVSFAVFDLSGNQLQEPVQGGFRLGRVEGDTEDGRRLEFFPKFPTLDSYGDGGFRPGRRYIVNLLKGDVRRGVGLADVRGHGLETAFSFSFQTVEGTTTTQLFRDTRGGGPKKVAFEVTPRVDPLDPQSEVELNELSQMGAEIRLRFDQPLNPHSVNIPVALDLDPVARADVHRGNVSLEYTDRDGTNVWIPAAVDLERNTLEGSELVLRPLGVLPNNTTVRVIVRDTLEDMSGESNFVDGSYDELFGSFDTRSISELRFDALVEDFKDVRFLDLEAPFIEPIADLRPGAIRASFDFEGVSNDLDYVPDSQEVVLDTDFTQVTPTNGQPITVVGGVFNFRNVRIPKGVTVRATGSRPMIWVVTGDFIVEGNLIASGGNGERVTTVRISNFPSGGGIGNAHGGNGGRGSPSFTGRSFAGETGSGAGQIPGRGGVGGKISCLRSGCSLGSGGGGGAFSTQGDPYFKTAAVGNFVQPTGKGGFGCHNRESKALPGGDPGQQVFVDSSLVNNFWGSALDRANNVRVTGELVAPQGGQGGGGGGDDAGRCNEGGSSFSDDRGGGGGAGGGALVIKALGKVEVTKSGRIVADGGHGGGGAWVGSNDHAGGGGGGSGGMVVLMAGDSIVIHTHISGGDGTYTGNDYDFAISADGGIGRMDGRISEKYTDPTASNLADSWNAYASGGFGGLGIIQLMAPPGDPISTSDGTNTILDDNIDIVFEGATLFGSDKMRFLGWRGMPGSDGVFRDDSGAPVITGRADGGDMRPRPILVPAPFGSRSRARSRWIDMGAVDRVMAASADGPRSVVQQPSYAVGETFGPLPEFAALEGTSGVAGFVRTVDDGVAVRVDYPKIVGALAIASVERGRLFRGSSAIVVNLQVPSPELGSEANRYANYAAVLRQGPTVVGEFRILGHDGSALYVDAGDGVVPDGVPLRLDVLAKFFTVFTGDVEGFSKSFVGRDGTGGNPNVRVPRTNLQIAFAFHQNPSDPTAQRYPSIVPGSPLTFFADWDNPARLEEIRSGGYRYVMYDIIFDSKFEVDPRFPNTAEVNPEEPRLELRRLVLPYRY